MDGLCFEENDITRDYAEGNPRWIVKLNNGQNVYSFDHHEVKTESSWVKLKKYCEENKLYIVDMKIHFRSNIVSLPENQNGYFFRRGILASLLSEYSQHFMYVGYLDREQIVVKKYQVPAMLLDDTELRTVEGNEDSLILKV